MRNIRTVLFALSLGFPSGLASAEGLKTINNPQGGRIVFGQVQGQDTEAGAMGFILRSIHNQFGDRPKVGRLFQVRGTQSVATFPGKSGLQG